MARSGVHRRTASVAAAGIAALLILAPAEVLSARAQEPTLWSVMVRATAYVEELHARLAGVVMEERYEQRAMPLPTFHVIGNEERRVTLLSDYLLVRPDGSERYFGFRDVFEANGSRVRDREERLARLFLDGATSLDRRVRAIVSESARYNVGDVHRTMNTPTLPLLFLRRVYRGRFDFDRISDRMPSLGVAEPDTSDDIWVIAYTETHSATVIRRRDGTRLPARGRYWIEPETGRVLVTEIVIEDPDVDALITVRYDVPAELDHLVPVEMRERYQNHLTHSRVEGTATYSRFRRFRVVVEESDALRD